MEFHGRSSANLLGHFNRETGLLPEKTTHCDDEVEKQLANPYNNVPFGLVETYDYESTQRIDNIRDKAGVRFSSPWNETYAHKNQQETDYFRQKMKSAFVMLPRHKHKDGQANEQTQAGMISCVPYDVPKKQEYTYEQGTGYLQEKTNLPFVRLLSIHDYENGQGNEHTQAEMRLRELYNVQKKREYTSQHGTEYLQEKTNLPFVGDLPIHEFGKGQGIEQTQVEMKPGRPYNVPEKHEYINQQGTEYIREKTNTPCGRVFPLHEYKYGQGNKHTRAVMRSHGPYNVSENHEYTNQQGTEYIREKTNTPMVQSFPSHEYKIGGGKEYTRAAIRSHWPYNVPLKYEYTTEQGKIGGGKEYTRAAIRSHWPYNVPLKYEYTTEQGIENIREKTHTPHAHVLPKHGYENEQGIEHIQATMKSPTWTSKQNELFEFWH